ncbi:hypothetical protein DDZ18_01885 [Marinicauda salina]|uniref:Uncharacterized protein n=1 Tax=Marinicauda salina TaxID=2135793 RepID=A0A2U2BWL8_9PROT|nr:hypothetical protein [Marinicauda salina]PWE18380.1 hypothetical protein DDZ18_01885 [Marinicauda salina]
MFELSLYLFAVAFGGFALACLARWAVAVRALKEDAAAEYALRKAEKPATIAGIGETEFTALYLRTFQPRGALYAAGAAGSALALSPVAMLLVPALYDAIWLAVGAPEWAGRGGYAFMFALFFGIVAVWAAAAAVFARLHHRRAPEPWSHALARARGEPIPEETGWRRRPKWARRARPVTSSDEAADEA